MMLEQIGSWLAQAISAAVVWFDHQPSWIQGLIVLVIIAAVVALTHCDELRRAHDWAEFRAWQERRRRAARLKGGRWI